VPTIDYVPPARVLILVSGNTHVRSCAEEEGLLQFGSPPETRNISGIFLYFLNKLAVLIAGL
jgi:hypothetical protein